MEIFEFHFNPPKTDKDKLERKEIFEIFPFQPKDKNKECHLFVIGKLKNPLPANLNLLSQIANFVGRFFERVSTNFEKQFKEILINTNNFLEEISKNEELYSLGNLEIAILAIHSFKFYFSISETMRILLLRGGEIRKIEEHMRKETLTDVLKPFNAFANLQLIEGDLLLVLPENILFILQQEDLLSEIAQNPNEVEKILNNALKTKKEKFSNINGFLLSFSFPSPQREISGIENPPPSFVDFSFKNFFKFYFEILRNKISRILSYNVAKLVAALFLILIFAHLIINFQMKKKIEYFNAQIKTIESNVVEAEQLLNYGTLDKKYLAQKLLKSAYDEVLSLSKYLPNLPFEFRKQTLVLKEKIQAKLFELNHFIEIKDPQIYFQLNIPDAIPNKIIPAEDNLYLISSFSRVIYKLNKEKKLESITLDKRPELVCSMEGMVVIYSKPQDIFLLSNNEIQKLTVSLPIPNPEFEKLVCKDFSLYFYEKHLGQIVKYLLLKPGQTFKIGEPRLLLNEPKVLNSIAIDDFLLILKDNFIEKYKDSYLKEKIKIVVFPEPTNLNEIKVFPPLPFYFISEPSQNRLLIFKENGELVKQIYSRKFNNILDFTISNDKKSLLILNDQTIYQIAF